MGNVGEEGDNGREMGTMGGDDEEEMGSMGGQWGAGTV